MKTQWILFLIMGSLCLGAEAAESDHTDLFRTTVIEEVSFRMAPLDKVIQFLQEETRQGNRQVNFVIPPETNASERMVTLDLRKAKAVDVFATVLRMTETRAEIRRGMVWILPESEEGPDHPSRNP